MLEDAAAAADEVGDRPDGVAGDKVEPGVPFGDEVRSTIVDGVT